MRTRAGVVAAALLVGVLAVPPTAAQAVEPTPAASEAPADPGDTPPDEASGDADVPFEPTFLTSSTDKYKAADAIAYNPDTNALGLSDQAFVLLLWKAAKDGSYVQAGALRAYLDTDAGAASAFILTGIFQAADDDAQVEIAEAAARGRRARVAVTVGLDPADTALIEKSDRDFIFAVWQRVTAGSHVWTAAQAAIADGTDQDDWDAFLNTGAAEAADLDMREAIEKANEEEAAKLRAAQLLAAKKALLQLLLLNVTDEVVNAPNKQYVIWVKDNAKGDEVKLAAQEAVNAVTDPEQALLDFIFTGGAAANSRDEAAAAAIELKGYRDRVIVIRDAAKHDGFQPNLLAAAEQALATNTAVALQTFLLKGQDEASAKDRRLDFGTGLETADSRPNFQNTVDSAGSTNVGGFNGTLTKSELGVRAEGTAHAGTAALMYSGKDTSDTKSFAYNQAYVLHNVTVRSTSQLSYWIYPQSTTTASAVVDKNSTCVAVDLIFGETDGSTRSLRDSGAKDQRGNLIHPAKQCGTLQLDTWNEVIVNIGAVADGKTLLKINVGYDQPANTGGYRGYIDDLKITDLGSAPKFRTSAESGETKLGATNTVSTGTKRGGMLNVGPIVSSVTGPELKEGATTGRTGSNAWLYSGVDNNTTTSYAYMKAYVPADTYVTATTTLSYWIFPQSKTAFSSVTNPNSTCVAMDLIFEDKYTGALTSLRDSGAKDQKGNSIHPAKQCSKLTLDTWNFVSVSLAAVANGKRIAQIDVGYDQPGGSGGYRGYIDDVRITQ